MDEQRPNPDELLARVQAEAVRQQQGMLKIFLGAAAGVGKTYAMLETAQERKRAGVDVVVGWVDTHDRAETEALLAGLEILPRRALPYREVTLYEFDLDGALARRPALIIVDELAHSNVDGARHAKRWQDVEELLQAGIDVYTAINVQHIESLNDVIAQITGVVIRETVPDAIIEQADEIELIDLPPDELLQRLRQGKVYVPQQAERAMSNFFRKGNLIALRELALRRTAERVDAQMQAYRSDHAIGSTWPAAERIMVCVSPSPLAPRLVRAARRMAAGLRAEWVVVYVEMPGQPKVREADRVRVMQTLHLAEQLGAETATLRGPNISDEILAYARRRNVTKIVAGKPTHPRWRDFVFGSLLDDLVRHSGDIDVYVISGTQADASTELPLPRLRLPPRTSPWPAYAASVGVVVLCTVIAWLMLPFLAEANLVMVYLLGVVLAATRRGRGPAVTASILRVAAYDFFFVPPFYTFAVAYFQYLITFAVMLVVVLVISTLTVRLRLQAQHARDREQRTAALYTLSHDLASMRTIPDLLQTAVEHISALFATQVAALLPAQDGQLTTQAVTPVTLTLDTKECSVAKWTFDHGEIAGYGTSTLPGAEALYLPLRGSHRVVGVLGIWPRAPQRLWEPEQLHLLETFTNQIAVAVERATLAAEAEQSRVQIETERLRNTLLSTVSHDLRTPLASITGAASSLLEDGDATTPTIQHDLLETIVEEGERLNRLVANLLEMTRLESGRIELNKEWQPLEEVIGAALARLDRQLSGHTVTTHLPAALELVPLDGVLIEQVLVNLLENAVKYTPRGNTIEIQATVNAQAATISVMDEGPGLPPGDEQRVFNKFYRGEGRSKTHGVGLGLSICRAIVEAHGGRIWAEARAPKGTSFVFTLPIQGSPPAIVQEMSDSPAVDRLPPPPSTIEPVQ
jgi:two-component system sensor histidine kinase KdpD